MLYRQNTATRLPSASNYSAQIYRCLHRRYAADAKIDGRTCGQRFAYFKRPLPGEEGTGMSMNLDVNAAIQIISHVKPRMAILTHFGLQMLKADPIVQAREVQKITGIQTIAAYDGLAIGPGSGPYHSPVKGFD